MPADSRRLAAIAALALAAAIPSRSDAQVAFAPSVSSFPDGVGLSVTPVVSADRRYVRMGIAPFFTGLQGFDTYSVPAAVGGTGGNGNVGPLFAGLNGLSNPAGGVGGVPSPGLASFGPNSSLMPMASPEASAVLSGRFTPSRPPSLSAAAGANPTRRVAPRSSRTKRTAPIRTRSR